MSKKGNDTPAVTHSTQEVKLPKWVEDAGAANYQTAKEVSKNLIGPYEGNTVAGLNGDQKAAYQMVRDNVGAALPSMNSAIGTLGSVSGYGGQQIGAQKFTDADLSSYMNPYSRNVIDAAQATERQTLAQNLNGVGAAATQSGAFGGSRQAIQEGVAQGQSALNMGNLTAQLQNANFAQAQQAIGQDQNRQLTADQSNQQNALDAQRLRALAASQQAGVGAQMQQSMLQDASSMQAVGDAERAYSQDLLNQDYQRYMDKRQQPIDQLSVLQYALGVTPYGSTTTGTTTQTGGKQGGNSLAQGLGAGASILSSIVPLFGLLSDEDSKTDVEKLGRDPATGVEMAAYRYKGDPKSYPKVVGPASAQQMERAIPGSTTKAPDGKRVVKAGFLGGPAAPQNRGPMAAAPKAPTTKKTSKTKGGSFLGPKGKH